MTFSFLELQSGERKCLRKCVTALANLLISSSSTISKVTRMLQSELHLSRQSRSKPRRITTAEQGSWGTRMSWTGLTRTRRSPSGWLSKATIARACTRCPSSVSACSRSFPEPMIRGYWELDPGMERELYTSPVARSEIMIPTCAPFHGSSRTTGRC